jgi:hypothetical protein
MIHVHVGQARNIRNVAAGGLNKIGAFVSFRQQQITSGYAVRSLRSLTKNAPRRSATSHISLLVIGNGF